MMFILFSQKARLARIRIAKASSGAAFVSKKKAAEARMAAQESGLELDENYREEDIFELQHHHLLRCLEKTTVSESNGFYLSPLLVVLSFCSFLLYFYFSFRTQTGWLGLMQKPYITNLFEDNPRRPYVLLVCLFSYYNYVKNNNICYKFKYKCVKKLIIFEY